jgi:hypothetical protein
VAGRSIYYFEVGRSGRAIHRLTVLERTADRFVLASENVTPIHGILTTAFEPGALQSVTFVDRRRPPHLGLLSGDPGHGRGKFHGARSRVVLR